jgi:hypothetical protein
MTTDRHEGQIYQLRVVLRGTPRGLRWTPGFMAHRRYYAGFGRGQSDEDLQDAMDEFDEESDSFSDYDPNRFDRRQINRALGKLATSSYEEALDEIHNPSVGRIPRRAATQRSGSDN